MSRDPLAGPDTRPDASGTLPHPEARPAGGSTVDGAPPATERDAGPAPVGDRTAPTNGSPGPERSPRPAPQHARPATRFLGDYELLDEVARGGMGVVYRARQVNLDRVVALKVVRDPALASFAELRRFRTEAEAVAQLDHPNIVPIYEVGQVDDQPYFSMKLIEGGTLSSRVARLRQDPRAAAALIAKVARAVHYAHQRAVLHRDLKPSNILLGEDGEPFVADFGLAKRIDPDRDTATTLTGVVMGTPEYMPPEQARGGTKSVTTAADVYGLGATLYATLTGRAPFAGDSVAEVLRRVLDDPPTRPLALNAAVDRDLETICLKCLEKVPARRYGSAEALAEDLERWLDGRPIAARPASPRERAVKWVRRHRTLAALIAVSAVSLISIAVQGAWLTMSLRAALESAESQLYANAVEKARRAVEGRLPVLAGEILNRQDQDRRGFEWYFLRRLCTPLELRGHRSKVRAVAFHPSGRPLVSAGEDGKVWFWDLAAGTGRAEADDPPRRLGALAVSPDGRWFATGGDGMTVTIRDAAGERPPRRLGSLGSVVWDIAFSPDSRRLAFGLADQVRVVDVEEGETVLTVALPRLLVLPRERRHSLAIGPGGRLAVSCGREIRVYEADDAERFRTLAGPHTEVVTGLAFSPDGRRLASSGEDGRVVVWDPGSGEPVRVLSAHQGIATQVVYSRDGVRFATAGVDGRARIWDAATGQPLREFPHDKAVQSVAFHPVADRLATAGSDTVVRVWDFSGNESVPLTGHQGDVVGVAVRPDGGRIASIGSDGLLAFWTLSEGAEPAGPASTRLPYDPRAVAYSPDGRLVAVAGRGGRVEVRTDPDGGLVEALEVPTDAVNALAFSPDGRALAVVGMEGTVRVWDRRDGTVRVLLGHAGTVVAVAYSPDGRRLATAGGDGVVRLWDPATGRLDRSFEGHAGFVNGLAFGPDGRYLASAGDDRTVRLWDLSRWWPDGPATLTGHSAAVLGVAFAPDSRRPRLATAGADGTVKLWDAANGLEVLTLDEHDREVSAVAFGPDGRFLVSSGQDRTLRLWVAGP